MSTEPCNEERHLAELLLQVGRCVYGDSFSDGLTPAQCTALRYFARANRFSRTVSAFAQFHSTTRGTASQTVKGLVSKGLLERRRCPFDGRSGHIEPTRQGLAALTEDPLETLVRAASALSPQTRHALGQGLGQIAGELTRGRGRRPFGICGECRHLHRTGADASGDVSRDGPGTGYCCGLNRQSLEACELGRLCCNFDPGPAGTASFRGQHSP